MNDSFLNKSDYEKFCISESKIPIFSQPWWLDVVCGENNWDVILVEKGGQIVASMPYFISSRLMTNVISMPLLTQKLGPYIKYPNSQKYDTRLSYEKEIMNELINKLPKFGYFFQNFDYSITNWLPFYWSKFNCSPHYTYVIDDLSDTDLIWECFAGKIRTEIKKAQKKVKVYSSEDLKIFYNVNSLTFKRQNLTIPYTYSFLKQLDDVLIKQNKRKIFIAEDDNKRIHAAIYIIWDDTSTYYLMGGGDPELRNSGATSLLIWEAIKFASTKTKKIDFEGSMIEGVESFFRSFGAIQKSYFSITKANSLLGYGQYTACKVIDKIKLGGIKNLVNTAKSKL